MILVVLMAAAAVGLVFSCSVFVAWVVADEPSPTGHCPTLRARRCARTTLGTAVTSQRRRRRYVGRFARIEAHAPSFAARL